MGSIEDMSDAVFGEQWDRMIEGVATSTQPVDSEEWSSEVAEAEGIREYMAWAEATSRPDVIEAEALATDPLRVASYQEFATRRGQFYAAFDVADEEQVVALRQRLTALEAANPAFLEEDNTRVI